MRKYRITYGSRDLCAWFQNIHHLITFCWDSEFWYVYCDSFSSMTVKCDLDDNGEFLAWLAWFWFRVWAVPRWAWVRCVVADSEEDPRRVRSAPTINFIAPYNRTMTFDNVLTYPTTPLNVRFTGRVKLPISTSGASRLIISIILRIPNALPIESSSGIRGKNTSGSIFRLRN